MPGPGEIELGRAYVRVGAETRDFESSLGQLESRMASWARGILGYVSARAIGRYVASSFVAGVRDVEVERRLRIALASIGQRSQEAYEAALGGAKRVAREAGLAETEAVGLAAKAVEALHVSGPEVERVLRAVVGYSYWLGSADAAMDAFVRAVITGNDRALKPAGVSLAGLDSAQERLNRLLEAGARSWEIYAYSIEGAGKAMRSWHALWQDIKSEVGRPLATGETANLLARMAQGREGGVSPAAKVGYALDAVIGALVAGGALGGAKATRLPFTPPWALHKVSRALGLGMSEDQLREMERTAWRSLTRISHGPWSLYAGVNPPRPAMEPPPAVPAPVQGVEQTGRTVTMQLSREQFEALRSALYDAGASRVME